MPLRCYYGDARGWRKSIWERPGHGLAALFLCRRRWRCVVQRGVGGAALRPRLAAAGSAPPPRSVPRSPRARPHCGASAGAYNEGAWAAPFGGPLSPARAPSGPHAGRSRVVAGARFRPPARRAPRRPWRRLSPFAAAGPPLGGPLAAAGRGRSGGPSSGAGGRRAALPAPPLPLALRPVFAAAAWGSPPLPLPSPSPSGGGGGARG